MTGGQYVDVRMLVCMKTGGQYELEDRIAVWCQPLTGQECLEAAVLCENPENILYLQYWGRNTLQPPQHRAGDTDEEVKR